MHSGVYPVFVFCCFACVTTYVLDHTVFGQLSLPYSLLRFPILGDGCEISSQSHFDPVAGINEDRVCYVINRS